MRIQSFLLVVTIAKFYCLALFVLRGVGLSGISYAVHRLVQTAHIVAVLVVGEAMNCCTTAQLIVIPVVVGLDRVETLPLSV